MKQVSSDHGRSQLPYIISLSINMISTYCVFAYYHIIVYKRHCLCTACKYQTRASSTAEHAKFKRNTHLFFQRHHEDAAHLKQVLHVILVLLLHPGSTVHPVILTALQRNLQAVTHNKGRLTELKPKQRQEQRQSMYTCLKQQNVTYISGHLLVTGPGKLLYLHTIKKKQKFCIASL